MGGTTNTYGGVRASPAASTISYGCTYSCAHGDNPDGLNELGVSMEVEHLVFPNAPRVGTDDVDVLSEEKFAHLEIESEVNGAFTKPV